MSTIEIAEHSKLSPSSSDRWLACSVSPSREQAFEDTSNPAAEEGTAAHALAEQCLRNGCDAASVKVTDADAWSKYYAGEFAAYVQEYLDLVRGKINEGDELYVEQRLVMYQKYGVYGTADAVIIGGSTLKVIDLKFGKGVFVETEDNPQLMLYAWGALDTLVWAASEEITHVEVTICQPRKNNTVSVTFTAEYLSAWIAEQLPKVEKAFRGIGVGSPGEHCRWCRAKGVCKERAEANLAMASFDFNASPPTPPAEGACNELNEEQLVNIFIHIPQIRQYLTDIESEVTRRANDHYVQGIKFVAGRNSRKIVDEKSAILALGKLGIQPYKEQEILGITEIEKRLKALGMTVEAVLGATVEKVQGKPILVGDADKRPALTGGSDFE